MSGRYLLDTNVIIALFAREQTVLDRLAAADAVFVPVVALGELYYGARKSGRVAENLERIDEFAAATTLLDCNRATAQRYGEIKNDLRAKGRPIPEKDITNDNELNVTLARIARFQEQVAQLRRVESSPSNYHAAVSGFLAEIDRMQLEVREYVSVHPAELGATPIHEDA